MTAAVDGQVTEITPEGVSILSGQHELTLSAPGYVPETVALTVVAGINQNLGSIELTPADATLSLNSTPAGAGVTVDGVFAGLTPIVLPLSPSDRHAISLSRAGYRPATLSLTLAKGETTRRSITLEPDLGEVRVTILPPEAALLVNGKVVGTGNQTLSLPATPHRI